MIKQNTNSFKDENKSSSKIIANDNTTKIIEYLKFYEKENTKPLTLEQERELIEKYLVDNPDKLKELLIIHNIRLVFKIAKKYVYTSKDFDELVGRGLEGLVYATTKFDYTRKTKFSTYAARWIKKGILKEYSSRETSSKRLKKLEQNNSISNALCDIVYPQYDKIETKNYSLSCEFSSTLKPIYEVERDYLIKEIECLVNEKLDFSKNESEVYTRLILDDEPVKTVARDLNLSVNMTMKLKNKIIGTIQSFLKEKYDCALNEIYAF